MTLQQSLESWLCNNGLFPGEASAIFELFFSRLTAEDDQYMIDNIRRRKASEYPPMLTRTLQLRMGPSIMEWFGNNAPNHLARAIFVELCGLKDIGDA